MLSRSTPLEASSDALPIRKLCVLTCSDLYGVCWSTFANTPANCERVGGLLFVCTNKEPGCLDLKLTYLRSMQTGQTSASIMHGILR